MAQGAKTGKEVELIRGQDENDKSGFCYFRGDALLG